MHKMRFGAIFVHRFRNLILEKIAVKVKFQVSLVGVELESFEQVADI